jgi:hypothetical protein
LISKYTKKGTTTFTAEDPEKLEDILELQSKSLSKIKEYKKYIIMKVIK